jgi:hypothetical protein
MRVDDVGGSFCEALPCSVGTMSEAASADIVASAASMESSLDASTGVCSSMAAGGGALRAVSASASTLHTAITGPIAGAAASPPVLGVTPMMAPLTRGLHSSAFRLNVSTFCWISWVHDFLPVY